MKSAAVSTAFSQLAERAERVKNDQPQHYPLAASPGDHVRQGDIYPFRLNGLPEGCRPVAKPTLQLAPGNTQGSRHCLDSLEGVRMYTLERPNDYDGPIIELACERTITHPEHGHWVMPPGLYGIGYQRTVDALGERRVLD